MSRYGPLAAAVALLVGAAIDLNANGDTSFGTVMLAAGLVVLGAWLAIEIYHLWHEHEHHNDRSDHDSD